MHNCSADAESKAAIHLTDGGRGRLGLNSETQSLELQSRVKIDFPWENEMAAKYFTLRRCSSRVIHCRDGGGREALSNLSCLMHMFS